MSTTLPYRRTTGIALSLIIIDLPVLLAVAVIGWRYGYGRTWNMLMDYRMENPWTFIPSLAMTVLVVRKWWRR